MSAFITVVGHLGKDAEIKSSERGQFVTFTVCSSEFIGKKETPVWYSVNSDSTHTLRIAEFLKRGSNVVVSGSFAPVPYVRKDGAPGIDNKIFSGIVNFAGGSSKDGNTQQGAQRQPSQAPAMGSFNPPQGATGAYGQNPPQQMAPVGQNGYTQAPPQGATGAYGQNPPVPSGQPLAQNGYSPQSAANGYNQAPQQPLYDGNVGGYKPMGKPSYNNGFAGGSAPAQDEPLPF